jgi:glycosyltransferase involved in cell wall biosynthesis
MSRKKLILVVAAFFPDSYGGAERQALILAEALGRKGVDVTLVAPTVLKSTPLEEVREFGRILRKRVRAYPNEGGRHLLSFVSWSVWFPWQFRQRHWRGVPIYVFHARLHALGPALAAVLHSSPLLIKLGGGGTASEFQSLRSKKYVYGHLVERLLRRRVNSFVANSDQIVGELRALDIASDRIAEFPNGVALVPIEQLRAAMSRRSGHRFIYAGRLIEDKNVSVLYEAALALLETGHPVQLRWVGEGAEKDRLERLDSCIRHTGSIAFPGYVKDVSRELEAADFFVSASMREGQSNALLEAMSAGLLPIVFAASGVRDVITHGVNGFVLEEATTEAFVEAMRRALALTTEERYRMSFAARKFAEDNIGIDRIAERTLQIPALDGVKVGALRKC